MSGKVFFTILDGAQWIRWASIKSHVLGQIGINEKIVGSSENFIKLANDLYELGISQDTPFKDALEQIYSQLNSMTKSRRKKLRIKNIGKVGYDIKPHAKALKRASLATHRKPSATKQAAVKAYQDKHLVLVTKDGTKVFNNVKSGAAKQDREAFYQSWDWRTLRMKVIKKQGKRCNCCGAAPGDLTVGGTPVRLVVDHIKPLSKYWNLRLVESNLQVLCDECNMGKGAWDETDHRSESEILISNQLRYEVI